ncbi:DUF4857 domain-containing protein [Campylobacter sp. FMV-PI01]|uniref:DUF4857 domain-containing protein n=1 Tax=Campylobacter portucalensis TaxID=2608384 RepID=A0A6L5WIA8_9BACT|nr:DUF4857 domain-containing protein [Campylobacter portucalensis]MSN96784.1 DUF4857 domain-containing protein [Campylobacter portucalensis]
MIYLIIKEFQKIKRVYLFFLALYLVFISYFLINFMQIINSNSIKDINLQFIYTKNFNLYFIDILNLAFGLFCGLCFGYMEIKRLKLLRFIPLDKIILKMVFIGFCLILIVYGSLIILFYFIFSAYFLDEIIRVLIKFLILNVFFASTLYINAIALFFSKSKILYLYNILINFILVFIYLKINPAIIYQQAFYLNENLIYYELLAFIYVCLNLNFTIQKCNLLQKVFLILFGSFVFSFCFYGLISKIKNQNYIEYRVKFSPVLNDFITTKFDIKNRQTTHIIDDKEISEDEYFYNLPFDFYYYLSSIKNFPSKFDFFENDTSLITLNSQSTTIKKDEHKYKNFPYVGLIESQPKYLRLKYPDFLIDFDKKVVLNVNNLSIDRDYTKLFNEAFKHFNFPLIKYFQNSTILKNFDDGVFLVDSKDKIWHLKFTNGSIDLKDTGLIKHPIFIKIDENVRYEYHALMISSDEIGVISYDDYKFIKFPIKDDLKNFDITYEVNPLHKIITLDNGEQIITYVLNPDYTFFAKNILDKNVQYSEILKYFLPIKLDIFDYKFTFYFDKIFYEMIILNSILSILYFIFYKKFIDSIFILLFGFSALFSAFAYRDRDD